MTLTVPIYIEERPTGTEHRSGFLVRPVFHLEPSQRGTRFHRVWRQLNANLRALLRETSRQPRHDALVAWTKAPKLQATTVECRIELDSGSRLVKFFVVSYESLGRLLCCAASLPDHPWEVLPGQDPHERARLVLTRRLREWEKSRGPVDWDRVALIGKARIALMEVEFEAALEVKERSASPWAALFGSPKEWVGADELEETARPLHDLYPEELDRVTGRELEVSELVRRLAAADRRPLLLLGPRQVGKTALLHEAIWQLRARTREFPNAPRQFWWLSPQRLISGMSALGQWENRVLAILRHARDRGDVLCFDDLLGLFQAGTHAGSDLNVAQVLHPFLEKHQVRVVAEITPEGWRVLRERDRAFADLFHPLPLAEPSEPETARILIHTARQLEAEHGCELELDVLPTVRDLCLRFAHDAAFPGKAITFLRRLAVKHANRTVSRAAVLDEFHERTGVLPALLHGRASLNRAELVRDLSARVIGQEPAVTALAEVLIKLKARLNDPRRPLGSFLFLGPTGVGKTECARALAGFLFKGSDRLLRFDLNEFVEPGSASRLIGTPAHPEGLLTSAIRRQPFSVVLFDEIEKAAPEVFDVLLAVLDEGRLTDALGRTADFTNAVLVLTSNLGVREAASQLGFQAATRRDADQDADFVSAAEKFFRPEFFNRLDRVVPFRSLTSSHLVSLAHRLLDRIREREGLRRRELCLRVSSAAILRLAELGHHPQLGARALKRTVERQLAQPLAEQLAAAVPGTAVVAHGDVDQGNLCLRLQPLSFAEQTVQWPERFNAMPLQPPLSSTVKSTVEHLLPRVHSALSRMAALIQSSAPQGGFEPGTLATPERYVYCREQLALLRSLTRGVEAAWASGQRTWTARHAARPRLMKGAPSRGHGDSAAAYTRRRDAQALRVDLEEWDAESEVAKVTTVGDWLAELALLHLMTSAPAEDGPVALVLRGVGEIEYRYYKVELLALMYQRFFDQLWGANTRRLEPSEPDPARDPSGVSHLPQPVEVLFLEGPFVQPFTQAETGLLLLRNPHCDFDLVRVDERKFASVGEAQDWLDRHVPDIPGSTVETPVPLGPVLRALDVYATRARRGRSRARLGESEAVTDYRTGLTLPEPFTDTGFRSLLLSGLPLPPELDPP
jgi:ATP-dependent Clp protease ATP-binding subunit ClpC